MCYVCDLGSVYGWEKVSCVVLVGGGVVHYRCGSHQKKVQESPLFVSARLDRASSLHQPWKHTTINIKAGDLFLKQVTYQGDDSLHACGFGAHSFRHAHASALLAMGVSADKAAAHQQTSAGSLTSTYNLPVRQEWELPMACIEASLFKFLKT